MRPNGCVHTRAFFRALMDVSAHGVVKCSVSYFVQLVFSPAVLLLFYWNVNNTKWAIIDLRSLESYVIPFGVTINMGFMLDNIVIQNTPSNFMFISTNNTNLTTSCVFPCVDACVGAPKSALVWMQPLQIMTILCSVKLLA